LSLNQLGTNKFALRMCNLKKELIERETNRMQTNNNQRCESTEMRTRDTDLQHNWILDVLVLAPESQNPATEELLRWSRIL